MTVSVREENEKRRRNPSNTCLKFSLNIKRRFQFLISQKFGKSAWPRPGARIHDTGVPQDPPK